MNCHNGTGAAPDLGDDAGGHDGPDDVMAAVALAGDPVEALHIDGVGYADGRFQFRAAGNAAGHGLHLRVIDVFNRIVVKTGRTPLRLPRESARPWTGSQWNAMDSNEIVSNPIQSIANAFHRIGMDTIAMYTYAFIAAGTRMVEDVLAQQDPALSPSTGRQPSPQAVFWPAAVGQTTVQITTCEHPFGAR